MQYSSATHHTQRGILKKKKKKKKGGRGGGKKIKSSVVTLHTLFTSQRSLMFPLLKKNALQITVVQVERSVLETISLHFELFATEKYSLQDVYGITVLRKCRSRRLCRLPRDQ